MAFVTESAVLVAKSAVLGAESEGFGCRISGFGYRTRRRPQKPESVPNFAIHQLVINNFFLSGCLTVCSGSAVHPYSLQFALFFSKRWQAARE